MESEETMSNNSLITALQNPALYDHPVTGFQVIETHVSWVILTGSYAYKIKKPVDFEFLNYSTLDKRRYYCHEELRLNRFWAPEIYCGVVPIYGTSENPQFSAQGEIIEYAVKMKEFPQSVLFSALLARNGLTLELMDELAKNIAIFHQQVKIAPVDSELGSPAHVHAPVLQNFEQILPLLTEPHDIDQANNISAWFAAQYQQLESVFQQRKAQGYVRECHGDIYLNNIILWEGKPTIFDCIEFNDDFRWTDVMADIGFLAMDLEDNQQPALAHQVINTYLKYSGDYAGLKVLPYYLAHRAVVRAKVALFRLFSLNLTEQEIAEIKTSYRSYMALAERYTKPATKALMITHGFSGSGKSTLAKAVMHEFGAIHISSDIERKRSAGLDFTADSKSAINSDLYSFANTQKNYQHLANLAELILAAGFPVIVDATCLKRYQRKLFAEVAQRFNIPLVILSCQADERFLTAAIAQRKLLNHDPSEATPGILAMQIQSEEPLINDELQHLVTIDTDKPVDLKRVYGLISRKINSESGRS